MGAREIIEGACFDPGKFVGIKPEDQSLDCWRSHAAIAALTAAGYRILGPEQLDPVTVDRCNDAIRNMQSRYGQLVMREEAVASLRSMSGGSNG